MNINISAERLTECGVAAGTYANASARLQAALREFHSLYGERNISVFSAPGRTELGGNHTDHQNGCVLAAAVDLDVLVVAAKTDTGIIRVVSPGHAPNIVSLDTLEPQDSERDNSTALVRGIAAWFAQNSYAVGGFDAYLQSEVPAGSGLSSSAAFEVAIGAVLNGLYNDGAVPPVSLAKAGQYAENVFFGKPCGLMDQTASAVGGVVAIDFADSANPIVRPITLDLAAQGFALCITSTGGSHSDLTNDYAAVPAEMKAVARALGCNALRECDETAFYTRLSELRGTVGDRAVVRAVHFFNENRRAELMASALEHGNFNEYLALVCASGASSWQFLQNVYSPASPDEQGVSVALALSERLLGGGVNRVHGGGFAGTIQAYVPFELLAEYRKGMDEVFGGGACRVLNIRTAGAVQLSK